MLPWRRRFLSMRIECEGVVWHGKKIVDGWIESSPDELLRHALGLGGDHIEDRLSRLENAVVRLARAVGTNLTPAEGLELPRKFRIVEDT